MIKSALAVAISACLVWSSGTAHAQYNPVAVRLAAQQYHPPIGAGYNAGMRNSWQSPDPRPTSSAYAKNQAQRLLAASRLAHNRAAATTPSARTAQYNTSQHRVPPRGYGQLAQNPAPALPMPSPAVPSYPPPVSGWNGPLAPAPTTPPMIDSSRGGYPGGSYVGGGYAADPGYYGSGAPMDYGYAAAPTPYGHDTFSSCFCHSTGDMVVHTPYCPGVPEGYYYFRPYHVMHVTAQQEMASRWGGDPRNPYDIAIIERVYAMSPYAGDKSEADDDTTETAPPAEQQQEFVWFRSR